MIVLVCEGASDATFFEYVIRTVLRSESQLKIINSYGIDNMLKESGALSDAIRRLQRGSRVTKVIAVFDWDKMHEPYGKRRRIERLRELLQQHPYVGGFPVRENLEDLVQNCLPHERRSEFENQLKNEGKETAVKWAIRQNLDQEKLKVSLTDLQRSLDCQLIRDF